MPDTDEVISIIAQSPPKIPEVDLHVSRPGLRVTYPVHGQKDFNEGFVVKATKIIARFEGVGPNLVDFSLSAEVTARHFGCRHATLISIANPQCKQIFMKSTKIAKLERKIDEHLVATLEKAVEMAKSGEIRGVVMLVNLEGKDFSHVAGGDMEFSEVVLAFESFKFDQLMSAWAEERVGK